MDGNGNWRGMFEQEGRAAERAMGSPPPIAREETTEDDGLALDPSVYKPWVIQRGRSRPAMMLDLRRFEPKSGMWMGWQLAYPHLVAVEYVGERMISLDFGQRHFTLEGQRLDELRRQIQHGVVLAIHEYAPQVWPTLPNGPFVSTIRDVQADARSSTK